MENEEKDYIDITEQIKNLLRSRNLILIYIFLFSALSVAASFLMPVRYMSYSVLNTVKDETSNNNLPSIDIPSFGGIVESAGLNLNSGTTNLDDIIIETIKSKTFLRHLLTFEGISEKLIDNSLDIDSSYIEIDKKIYSKDLSASINKDTGLIVLSFKHRSPEFAKLFLQLIIDEVNNVFRKEKLSEIERARKYFESEYEIARNASIRSSISYLLEKNLNSEMLANVREEYVLESIEVPFIPEERYSPNRILILIIGSLLGLLIGSLTSLIRHNLLNQAIKK